MEEQVYERVMKENRELWVWNSILPTWGLQKTARAWDKVPAGACLLAGRRTNGNSILSQPKDIS
jgi:hypothetical protein